MASIQFPKEGGEQKVEYTLSCGKDKLTFDKDVNWITIPSDKMSKDDNYITVVVGANESGKRDGNVFAKIDGKECTKKKLSVSQDSVGGQRRASVVFEGGSTLSSGGQTRRRVARWTSDDPDFDINDLAVNADSWVKTEIEQTGEREGNIYISYGATSESRATTLGVTYRRAPAEGNNDGQNDYDQPGDTYKPTLQFKITENTLNECGGETKIGEYYFDEKKPKKKESDPDEYYYDYVENTSFTCTTKPNWISSIVFGIPDTKDRKGDIIAVYSKNTTNISGNEWNDIQMTYTGYENMIPRSGSYTTINQPYANPSLGRCGEGTSHGTAPSACTDANFYHWDNPYVPGDLSYYYLEHRVTAYEQDYTLRTAADFCEYEIVEYKIDGKTYERKVPISTIDDPMWKDVRVEIYDIVPSVVHNSACGLHHVVVEKGDSFAKIKERHTSGDSKNSCACPCWFDGWNPNNGAYEIDGYNSAELLAVFEDGVQVSGGTEYDSFWFKATDCRHEYTEEDGFGCRKLNFHVERNTGKLVGEKCAMIKVYPKIKGKYCTDENGCQNCERTARCKNERNCCITDMIVQEGVDCSCSDTFFKLGLDGHAWSPRYIQTGPGEGVSNQVLYEYEWGPCDDINSSSTAGYVDAVDIYEGSVIRSDSGSNIYHECKIGKYIGTIYANCDGGFTESGKCKDFGANLRTEWSGDSKFSGGECITSVSFESKCDAWDSDNKCIQHRGLVYFSANGYSHHGSGPNDPKRYRVRILVPYHKGENYWGTARYDWKFTEGDPYYTWYGPTSNGYQILNGHGIFCVLEQDGRGGN